MDKSSQCTHTRTSFANAGHLVLTAPVSPAAVTVPVSPESEPDGGKLVLQDIELVFDGSGLSRSSRDQPEARHYCPEPGCKASFKRKYDIDRHRQAVHTQSKNFFCPVEGCKYSVEPNIASLSRYYGSPWHDVRRPLKSKLLADDKDTGYTRYLLYGFHRKDKLLKHLAKHHKGLEIELSSLLEEKDACQKDPVLAENQKFHSENVNYWELDYALLGRFQRSDGSWSTWSGKSYDRVAALGFKPWVNPGIPQSSNMSKVSYKTDQPAPGSASAYAQGSSSSTSSNAREGIVQLSQGQTMSPFAFQLPRGIHPALSMGQIITNNDDQGVWCPSQQFTQTELFPNHGHANNWIPQSNGFMQTASTAVSAPMSPLSFSDFRTELIAPIQVSEPEGNMTGTSTNMFDFDDMSFEGISGGVYVPANGSYAPAETGQMIPEIFNTGNGEELDSSINTGFDADTWNSSNGSQRW